MRIRGILALTLAAFAISPVPGALSDSTGGSETTIITLSPPPPPSGAGPLSGNAMWIWEVPHSSGGSSSAIGYQASQYGIDTVIVKSSDGSSMWSQFSSGFVNALKAQGLRVCAWQYVYGNHPVAEAINGARARRRGAQCLVIDAESEYEGRYASAQIYLRELRKRVGRGYPVALAGFPYVDYHPAFPYSVFLGPGGAQYNAPQMYWKAIGTSVSAVFSHTYTYNSVYRRAIFPLGQVYMNPSPGEIKRFRSLARDYGAHGVSWWDWQEASSRGWRAVAASVSGSGSSPQTGSPALRHGSRGDLVVWAQEHLLRAGENVPVSGIDGWPTVRGVQDFQSRHGLYPDGVIGPMTWAALLRYAPQPVTWTSHGKAKASAARVTLRVPASASLSGRREIPPKSHGL